MKKSSSLKILMVVTTATASLFSSRAIAMNKMNNYNNMNINNNYNNNNYNNNNYNNNVNNNNNNFKYNNMNNMNNYNNMNMNNNYNKNNNYNNNNYNNYSNNINIDYNNRMNNNINIKNNNMLHNNENNVEAILKSNDRIENIKKDLTKLAIDFIYYMICRNINLEEKFLQGQKKGYKKALNQILEKGDLSILLKETYENSSAFKEKDKMKNYAKDKLTYIFGEYFYKHKNYFLENKNGTYSMKIKNSDDIIFPQISGSIFEDIKREWQENQNNINNNNILCIDKNAIKSMLEDPEIYNGMKKDMKKIVNKAIAYSLALDEKLSSKNLDFMKKEYFYTIDQICKKTNLGKLLKATYGPSLDKTEKELSGKLYIYMRYAEISKDSKLKIDDEDIIDQISGRAFKDIKREWYEEK